MGKQICQIFNVNSTQKSPTNFFYSSYRLSLFKIVSGGRLSSSCGCQIGTGDGNELRS